MKRTLATVTIPSLAPLTALPAAEPIVAHRSGDELSVQLARIDLLRQVS